MNRRQLLTAGGIALAAPLQTFAQQKVWRVGVLSLTAAPSSVDAERFATFVTGMRELGYVEGRNLAITWRFADNSIQRMAAMAAELVQSKVDVIVTLGVPPTAAAKKVTSTIPIVMGTATDPLGAGLVTSLGRPGGNITGLSNAATDISSKHLELLMAVVPKLARVGILTNGDTSSNATMVNGITTSARAVKVTALPVDARSPQQIDAAIAEMASAGAGAVIVLLAPLFNDQRIQIAQVCMKHRLPSVSSVWQYADAGGLMNYGPNLAEHFHRSATYVDKILKGAKPGDLPIEQPTSYELVINRKIAQTLKVTIPQEVLLRATRVIG